MVNTDQPTNTVINPSKQSDPLPPTDISPAPKPSSDPLPNPEPTPVPAQAGQQPVQSSAQPVTNSPAIPSVSTSSSNKTLYISGIGIAVVLIGMVVYILFPHTKILPTLTQRVNTPTQAIANNQSIHVPTVQPTAAITPVTASNADQQLNDTANTIGQSLTQVNTDLNSLNSIDTTQDNPNNL